MLDDESYILDELIQISGLSKTEITQLQSHHPSEKLSNILLKRGKISKKEMIQIVELNTGMMFIDLNEILFQYDTQLVAEHIVREYQILPIFENNSFTIVTANPWDISKQNSLEFLLGKKIFWKWSFISDLERHISQYYAKTKNECNSEKNFNSEKDTHLDITTKKVINSMITQIVDNRQIENREEGCSPIISLVSDMIKLAYQKRASDIHIEPSAKEVHIRFRIDGKLNDMLTLKKSDHSLIISRIKILTESMDLAEKRLPQDGRFRFYVEDKKIDLRVSCLPSMHGETMVIRLLEEQKLFANLSEIGFSPSSQSELNLLLQKNHGTILVVGPTGSGKTTTLYTFLNMIQREETKMITIEDPIEYQINGINQIQVNADIGMTFSSALRSILRQSPDVVMVGEIRDSDTASVAINATLTGHLVLSTLHTTDAVSALTRLNDLGIDSFFISYSISAIIAQRLIRTLCVHCKKMVTKDSYLFQILKKDIATNRIVQLMEPHGCSKCVHTGFYGRTVITEVLIFNELLRQMIYKKKSTLEIRKWMREQGIRSLYQDGLDKVFSGITTFEEIVAQVLPNEDDDYYEFYLKSF